MVKTDPEPARDIFSFANQLAWELGGPITIEDPTWKVIAYSTIHERIDNARRKTILGHAVPKDYFELLDQNQVREKFLGGLDIVEIAGKPSIKFARRLAAPIRLHNVVVGSIWVAESSGQLNSDSERLLKSAAGAAAIYFQLRNEGRSKESDLFLTQLLDGGGDIDFLSQYFHLMSISQYLVVALDLIPVSNDGGAAPLSVFGEYLRNEKIDYFVVERSGQAHFLCYCADITDERFSSRIEKCAHLISTNQGSLTNVGIGRLVTQVDGIPASRTEADRVLRYLRTKKTSTFAVFESVRTGVFLFEILEFMHDHPELLGGPLQRLYALPSEDRRDTLRILKVYFDTLGNSSEAARILGIHSNTFRYRLGKVVDTLDLNLADPESRLMLEVQLQHEVCFGSDGSL